MKALLASQSGFCDGVKRAIRLALNGAAAHGRLIADGPLVHNRQAVDFLSLYGVETGADALDSGRNRSILIRAHGVTPAQRRRWQEEGAALVDATCAHVAANQRLAADASARGLRVVLAGDRDHAEVAAVSGSAPGGCDILSTLDEARAYATDQPFIFMAQTTFDVDLFAAMAEAVSRNNPRCEVRNTICRATQKRQAEAKRLARRADALVVVGGKHSANTRRLAEAGRVGGKPVFAVETAADLDAAAFAGFTKVAVIAGASTPGWITQEVVDRLRFLGRTTLWTLLERMLYILVESRLLTAVSAFGLGLAAGLFLLRELRLEPALAAALYVFFAHTLNRRLPLNPAARRLSPTDSFYRLRRQPMLILAWLSLALGLALAADLGRGVFTLYLVAAIAASAFAWMGKHASDKLESAGRVWPSAAILRHKESVLSLVRLLAMAVGWALVLIAPYGVLGASPAGMAAAALFVLLLRLGGSLVRDLHDIASDRLMGIDTLPGHIGSDKAARLADTVLGVAAILPFVAAAGMVRDGQPSVGFVFLLCLPTVPALGIRLMELVRQGRLADGVRLRGAIDAMGCLAGLLALFLGINA